MNKKRNKYLAFFLTIITPGLGHLYNGQFKSAIIIPLVYILITFIVISIPIARTFNGLVIFLFFVIVFFLTFAVISFKRANSLIQYTLKSYNRVSIYILWPLIFWGSDFIITPSNSLSAFSIPTIGMENTLKVNDMIFVDLEFYNNNEVKRDDIVIIKDPESDNLLIKRVIGLSDEKIALRNGKIYINDEYYQENNPNIIIDSLTNYSNYEEIIIPSDHFFVMGDYREQSKDSRIFGTIPIEYIRGTPLYIYYSETYSRIGKKLK